MTDLIERSLLTALSNLIGYRPDKAKIIGVIYDSDIPQMVKDIRAGLEIRLGDEPAKQAESLGWKNPAPDAAPGVNPENYHTVVAQYCPVDNHIPDATKKVASDLPPSLAVKPNIPWGDQTLDQLYAERGYWRRKIDDAITCGAAMSSAQEFRDKCNYWIVKREREAREVVAEDYHQ
jgi:hypothetical protein